MRSIMFKWKDKSFQWRPRSCRGIKLILMRVRPQHLIRDHNLIYLDHKVVIFQELLQFNQLLEKIKERLLIFISKRRPNRQPPLPPL